MIFHVSTQKKNETMCVCVQLKPNKPCHISMYDMPNKSNNSNNNRSKPGMRRKKLQDDDDDEIATGNKVYMLHFIASSTHTHKHTTIFPFISLTFL